MQTFVPYGDDFVANAQALDYRRLGKQRVEGLQILNTLCGVSSGWQNHPAVKMWRGYIDALADYTIEMCNYWVSLGYKDTCRSKVIALVGKQPTFYVAPAWLTDTEIQVSHRSNLIRKMPDFYSPLWPDTPSDLPYKWPVK